MKASDAIAEVLSANHVEYGFELIGGMIAHLVDSINVLGKTKMISLHHEQAAAFAAGGIARATNNQKLGLALGTSGPGATNLITGIADCWLDSCPCIFITGQVNTNELKLGRNIRQQGFQELDIVSIVKTITKFAHQITCKEEIIPVLQQAIDAARSDRPGPVLIDIPMDLQRAELPDDVIDYLSAKKDIRDTNSNSVKIFDEVFSLLSNASKPIFLIGGGAINEPHFTAWQKVISEYGLPHVSSLKGSEKVRQQPAYYGMIGSYGTRTANYAVQNCDLLVVLGSRMDVRQTGADIADFARNAKIIQIDLDKSQLENRVIADININSTCEEFLVAHLQCLEGRSYIEKTSWQLELDAHWQENFQDEYIDWSISPFQICQTISNVFKNKPVHYVADVGNNQMWVAHSLLLGERQSIHHSGGLGAMGFAIPTAIGVAYAGECPAVILTGDGGAQLNIQELDIIAREHLPVLTIVFNNQSLGMVRAFQEMYFDGRNDSTFWSGYSSSFSSIGKAYNIESFTTADLSEFSSYINNFIKDPKPMLIEVLMSDARECRPRLAFGNPIDKQYPLKDK
ncbi:MULTISPECIES: thiamine pyrophosphate-binding protein [Citrobacter]|uniref:thiamine pyrophosphate-binding protein n=1 Tax=Citrobacter sp. wls718 TaxID=2576418 RepID=UPI000DF92FFF|nr:MULTISPECIES: thiamine pyrophosphate-binding protein [Citrobacter]QMJ04081.1 thiamine pyrophosphate-binding protein [Citrobacter freundii]QMJ13149.1 thiamine pyrophosphate-binding protein [Citrobacter freundii]TKU34458.1 thiamine pyrophosphate-binding protein [Citrobacter sp. wls718]STE16368.1 acetohydroxy acid synthase II [Escherichia coli]